ncbi:DUF1778 domain-containing protein [uncultured Thiodictyon sp.]|nr:DUF1778 domain-containing protein [uncultured Thiodictyon sp.]
MPSPQQPTESARINDTLVLSQQAFAAFVAAGEDPSEPNEALRALMARR